MNLSKLPFFSLLTQRMGWLSKRQEVLAQNVANADTPKYVPHDLKAMDFRRTVEAAQPRLTFATTNASHMEPTRRSPRFHDQADKASYESAPSGNSVVLEEQLMKVSETQVDYRMVTNLYQKHVAMIKAVLSRSGA